ncbi:MAG: multicopper oxidase domain-containing protein, partial [Sagittula sp.]
TAFPHGMHLHGMHFREVRADGSFGPLRDTILSVPDEPLEIAFTADNPGKWLFHCHMLAHAASGMTTWINVT